MLRSLEENVEDSEEEEHQEYFSRRKRSVDETNPLSSPVTIQKIELVKEIQNNETDLNEILSAIAMRLLDEISDLRMEIPNLKLPTGTKESPAQSCHDILLGHPESPNGKIGSLYFISSYAELLLNFELVMSNLGV